MYICLGLNAVGQRREKCVGIKEEGWWRMAGGSLKGDGGVPLLHSLMASSPGPPAKTVIVV